MGGLGNSRYVEGMPSLRATGISNPTDSTPRQLVGCDQMCHTHQLQFSRRWWSRDPSGKPALAIRLQMGILMLAYPGMLSGRGSPMHARGWRVIGGLLVPFCKVAIRPYVLSDVGGRHEVLFLDV